MMALLGSLQIYIWPRVTLTFDLVCAQLSGLRYCRLCRLKHEAINRYASKLNNTATSHLLPVLIKWAFHKYLNIVDFTEL